MKVVRNCLFILSAGILSLVSYEYLQNRQYKKTDGFSLSRITSTLPFNPEWETASLRLEQQRDLALALAQEYTYLASGGQSFAFVSKDDNYVIKFYKHHRGKIPLHEKLPLPFMKQKMKNKALLRQERLQRDFSSFKIGMEDLKEESGLLFIHLNKTKHLRQNLKITDKAGRSFIIDLDQTEFILQKKAQGLYPQITAYMEKGEKEKAEQLLRNILSLIVYRSQKGICDDDPHIKNNMGCIEEKALFIDLGRFHKDPSISNPAIYLQNTRRITSSLMIFLEENYPELKSFLEQELHILEKQNLGST